MAAALALAASCNKMEEVNTPVDTPAATETITVELNPQTKTALDGMNTVWSDGDMVSVTVGGKKVGTLTLVSGSIFSGEITAGLEGTAEATLNYGETVPTTQVAVAGSFANGAALLEGTTTVAALRAGTGATLQNQTALLQFQTPVAGDVAFTIGSTTYTVTGCETGKTYYACVDPENTGKLTYTVGIVLGGKEASSFTPVANKIHPLGTLTLKESTFSVCGDNNSWGDTYMYETAQDNFFVCYGVTFSKAGYFKVRNNAVWTDEYNFGIKTKGIKEKNKVFGVFPHGDSQDIGIDAGTYDVYFDRLAGQLYMMETGKSYTDAVKEDVPSTKYCLIGSFNDSNWSDIDMTYSGDGIWTINQTFNAADEWKIRKKNDWGENWGKSNVSKAGKDLVSDGSDGNVKTNSAGDYVITFVKDWNYIAIVQK